MSNALALATVTSTLRNIVKQRLDTDVPGTQVTTRPLDKARPVDTARQLNIFLYQTSVNTGWSNQDFPGKVKPNETGFSPLALNLQYVVTAYGPDNDDVEGQRILGHAMSSLHDNPVLSSSDIQAALADTDLHLQPERIRISMLPLSQEEMSKLWTAFQTQYRLSVAYNVSVVLIESRRPAKAPLPVLRRGPLDRGPEAQADVIPPFPTITSVAVAREEPSALLGEEITVKGHHLAAPGATVALRLRHPLLTASPPVSIVSATANEIRARLDNAAGWLPGVFGVVGVVSEAGRPDRLTNEVPLMVSPQIVGTMPMAVARSGSGTAAISLTVQPPVEISQRVSLLVGDHEVPAKPRTSATGNVDFDFENAPAGEFFLRVRVEGADTRLVNRTVTPPEFIASQKITIT